jgi:hypothetical protein
MRHSFLVTVALLSVCAFALSGCGKAEQKMGSLTQRFTMMDAEGRNFGLVEMDPVGGGRIYDATGRVVGQIMPPVAATVASLEVPVAAQ